MYTLDTDGFIRQKRLPDQRLLAIEPMTFGRARIGIGELPPMHTVGVYAQTWDYLSLDAALLAFQTWNPPKTSEPDGWNRHPLTRRYRVNADPTLEYVKGDGNIHGQIAWAIQVTQGRDRIITDIKEDTDVLGASFPASTQLFHVTSESADCPHDPKCQWIEKVFHYLDRSVVITIPDLVGITAITVGNVVRRLTE